MGQIHHRHGALTEEVRAAFEGLPELPPPWNRDQRWYPGDLPPRESNRLEPLVHGDRYFGDLVREMAKARTRITIAGWCLSPEMPLGRGDRERETVFLDLVSELSRRIDVYILLWSGAPAVFKPDRKTAEDVRRRMLDAAPRIHCELDNTAAFSHDHHQKAVTIDGTVAYVGGMDISTFQGDRWDTAEHPIRSGIGWHDVQMRLEGPVVEDVETNFRQRWTAATGSWLEAIGGSGVPQVAETPGPSRADGISAQVVRTIPKGFYPSFAPDGHYGILHAILEAIDMAQVFIYIENQYLWAPEIVDALCRAMDRNGPDFRIVAVLPARAYTGRYDNDDHVRKLSAHDGGRGIIHAYGLYSGGPGESVAGYRYVPVYVHAKVMIVDDGWVLVGSANLNRRGLSTDSEIAVQTDDGATAKRLRHLLWSEHLGMSPEDIAERSPVELIDGEWKQRAHAFESAMRAGKAPAPGHLHPYDASRSPLGRLLDRVQSMTLEH